MTPPSPRSSSQVLRLSLWCLALSCFTWPAEVFAGPPSFAGRWQTSYGVMTLKQEQQVVTGTYSWEGVESTIKGQVKGLTLSFRYQDASGQGHGSFTLSSDGQSFKGRWQLDGEQQWGQWSGQRLAQNSSKTKDPKASPKFSGLWDSRYGRIRLVQKGQKVSGIYAYSSHARITGVVKGRTLSFQYNEAKGEAAGSTAGQGQFTLSEDGQSFQGRWRHLHEKTWRPWTGQRVRVSNKRRWLMVFEAHWETKLTDSEYSFGAMLKAFFAREPSLGVRHRTFNNLESLRSWCRDLAFLAEPVVLVLSTHGTEAGLDVKGQTISAKQLAECLRYVPKLELLHFASCLIMKGSFPRDLAEALGPSQAFPMSGYTRSVDWGASAVIDFMYYDLICARGIKAKDAAKKLLKLVPFAGAKRVDGAPFESAGFRFLSRKQIRQWQQPKDSKKAPAKKAEAPKELVPK